MGTERTVKMNPDEIKKFYEEQLKPYWEINDKIKNTALGRADSIFFDLLTLIITLSTGMMAFLAVMSEHFAFKQVLIDIGLFIIAIILAIFAKVISAILFKREADTYAGKLAETYRLSIERKFEELREKVTKVQQPQSVSKSDFVAWQKPVIWAGAASLLLFIAGVLYFVVFAIL